MLEEKSGEKTRVRNRVLVFFIFAKSIGNCHRKAWFGNKFV